MRMFFPLMTLLISTAALSRDHVARIVKIENSSQVYIPVQGKIEASDKLVKYLDQTFKIIPATKGLKLENGYVVTTGPDSKIKMVFKNGDHFFISPNTQYQLNWKREHLKAEDPSTMNLLKGAVRGLIEKDGPRSGMKIITKATVLGVRGTDFHVVHRNSGMTQISVLRGRIELDLKDKKNDVVIEAGQTFLKKDENSQLSKLTKTELKTIAAVTDFPKSEPQEKELKELEKKATEVTLKDIKTYQPELYSKIQKNELLNSETLARNTVEVLQKTAPETRKKPDWDDLIDERDPYDTYKPKNQN
jgi:hypothetical protein